jgi:hypothetical protein
MSWDLPVSVPTFSGPLVKLSHEPDCRSLHLLQRLQRLAGVHGFSDDLDIGG